VHGRRRIAPVLEQDVEDIPLLIHGPPEVVACATEGQKHLIQVRCIVRSRTPGPELIGIQLPERAAPRTDGFVGHNDPVCEQECFHIPEAEALVVV
jgi:hypothetical protein